MNIAVSHVHIGVKDVESATQWFSRVLGWEPSLQKADFFYYDLENIRLVIERSISDVQVTLALKTTNCNEAVEELGSYGVEILSPATDYPWGTRTAYIKGPGGITLEFEQEAAQTAHAL